jgi:hypothetical protein
MIVCSMDFGMGTPPCDSTMLSTEGGVGQNPGVEMTIAFPAPTPM